MSDTPSVLETMENFRPTKQPLKLVKTSPHKIVPSYSSPSTPKIPVSNPSSPKIIVPKIIPSTPKIVVSKPPMHVQNITSILSGDSLKIVRDYLKCIDDGIMNESEDLYEEDFNYVYETYVNDLRSKLAPEIPQRALILRKIEEGIFQKLEYRYTVYKQKKEREQEEAERKKAESVDLTIDNSKFIPHDEDTYKIALSNAISGGNHDDVAKAYFFRIGSGHAYYNNSNNKIFFWNKDSKLWEQSDMTPFMRDIKRKFVDDLEITIKTFGEEIHSLDDQVDKTNMELLMKKAIALRSKIKNVPFAGGAQKEYLTYIYDNNNKFLDSLNAVTPWLPLSNGKMHNIKTGETRDREPNDRCTRTLNCHNDPVDGKIVDKVRKIIWQIMGEDDVTIKVKVMSKFMLRTFGIYISGIITDKTFMIWYGYGNNGKSFLLNWLNRILGNAYFVVPKNALFSTKQGDANGHTAHITALKGRRLITDAEGDKNNNTPNWELLKRWTGGDPEPLRQLNHEYDDEVFTVKAHIILSTNVIPNYHGLENATVDRIILLPFKSKFCSGKVNENTKKFEPDESARSNDDSIKYYPIDTNLDETLKEKELEYNSALFQLIVEEIASSKFAMNPPQAVIAAKDENIEKYGQYSEFISKACEAKPDPGTKTQSSALYNHFKDFCSDQYDTEKPEFCRTMTKFGTDMKRFFGNKKGSDGLMYVFVGIKQWEKKHKTLENTTQVSENFVKAHVNKTN